MSPGGAFWTQANWIEDQYFIVRNHYPSSPDVGATHNLIIGPSYAWYATISGDVTYMNRAVDALKGATANLSLYNAEGQMWEGMRYDYDLIRWYRQFFETECSQATITQCDTLEKCNSINGNWSGERCQHAPIEFVTATVPVIAPPANLRIK